MASTRVELYKQQLLRDGFDPNQYTDEQLTNFLGQHYEGQGFSGAEIAQNFGSDFSNEYLDLKNRPDPNQGYFDEFTSGLRSSAYGLASTGVGAVGLGAGKLGLDGIEDSLMDTAAGLSQEASKDRPTIDRASDVRWSNPAEVVRFISGAIGEATPSVVESAAAFVGGGGIGYAVAKNQAKKAIRKSISERVEGSAGDQVESILKELVRSQARQGFATGSMAATGISSLGLGMGEIYTELYQNTKLPEDDPDYIESSRARNIALGFGAVSGGLDFVGAATLLGKLTGAPAETAKNYFKRLLLGLPEGVFVEGGTEAMQEFINVAAEKYGKGMEIELNGQELDRLFDAGVLGAVGGAQFTAIGALKGPKKNIENFDDSTPVAEDLTQVKQQNLLEDLQKNSTEEQFNFEIGDEVQIALGESGVLHDIVGNTMVVKLPDGTLKSDIDPRSLSHKIDIDQGESKPDKPDTEVKVEPIKDDTSSNTKESVRPLDRIKPQPTIEVDINGKKVTAEEGVAKNAQLLYEKMSKFAEEGTMSQNTARANKTGGWASNNQKELKYELGEDAGLVTPNTLLLLRRAEVLNASNEWILGTESDKKYDAEQELIKVNNRKRKISESGWIKADGKTEAKVRGTGISGVIEEITEDGKVVIGGETYEPSQVLSLSKPQKKKVNAPKSPSKTPSTDVEKAAQEIEKEKEVESLFTAEVDEESGVISYTANDNFKGFGKSKIRLLWKQNDGREAKRTDNSYLKNDSLQVLADEVRAFVDKKQKEFAKKAKKKGDDKAKWTDQLFGVEIDGVDYSVTIDENGDYDVAGLKIPPVDPQELEKQKGDLPALLSAKIDPNLDSDLDSNSKFNGKDLREHVGQNKALVVLRQTRRDDPKYREESIRVVSVRDGQYLSKRVTQGYDSETGAYIRFNGDPGKGKQVKTWDGWEIVGKINTTDAAGKVDLYFGSLAELESREDFKIAIEGGMATDADTKKFADARKAEQDIEKLLMPTEEEYNQARAEFEEELGDPLDLEFSTTPEYASLSTPDQIIAYQTENIIKLFESGEFFDGESGQKLWNILQAMAPEFTSQSLPLASDKAKVKKLKIEDVVEKARKKLEQKIEQAKPTTADPSEGLAGDAELEAKILTRAREIAKARVDADKSITKKIATEQKKADKATGKGSDYESRLSRFEEKKAEILADESLSEQGKEDAIEYQRTTIVGGAKNSEMGGSATSQSSQFETGGSYDKAIGETADTNIDARNEGLSVDDATDAGSLEEQDMSTKEVDHASVLDESEPEDAAGRGLSKFADLNPKKEILDLLIGQTSKFREQFLKLYNQYLDIKSGISEKDSSFENAVDRFLQDFYTKHAGVHFSRERIGQQETDFISIGDIGEARVNEMHQKLIEIFDIAERGNIVRKDNKARERRIKVAKELVEKAADSYTIFDKIMAAEGFPSGTVGNNYFMKLAMSFYESADARINIIDLSFDEIIDLFADRLLLIKSSERFSGVNKDTFRDTILEVFNVKEVNEDDRSPEYRNLRNYLKSFFNPSIELEVVKETEEVGLPQGKRYHDPLEEGKLNRGQQRIDNLLDPTTGEVTRDQVIVVSDETNKASIDNARQAKQSYMAPEENPLSTHPDLVAEGNSAMNTFAPAGIGVPFNLTTALNQIKDSNPKMASIANIARLLNNKTIQGFSVEFMKWEDFRPYASPAKGVLNKAVILHEQKRIIISDAYNNNTTHSAMDTLMADILHEAVHAVTRPALDLGYAYSSGKQRLVQEMIEKHGLPEDFNISGEALGKIWNDFNNKLLPYLREQGKRDLDLLYGLTSIDEFFSELSSDRKFMDFLDSVQMPKDMLPAKSKLRTVLDYILNLLAKLGFKIAQTDTALTYAREELRKLMDISNQTTELSERISAMNLREITSLASRFDTNDINLSYDELLERISQETARDSTGGNLRNAANDLAGRARATPTIEENQAYTSEPSVKYNEVQKYAEENGLVVWDFDRKYDAIPEEDRIESGSESDVYFDVDSQRIIKRNTLSIHNGNVLAYLNRLTIHNYLFPSTAYQLEGFSFNNGKPSVVVSQALIRGTQSTTDEINQHLKSLGIEPSFIISKIGLDTNISDLDTPGNAITDAQGNVHIIDPIIERESSMAKVLERKLDTLDDPNDILDTIYDLYNIPGYIPTPDIKSLKRSAEDELGISGQESGMDALMKAVMGGGTIQGNQFTPVLSEKIKGGKKILLTEALSAVKKDYKGKFSEASTLMSELLKASPYGRKTTFEVGKARSNARASYLMPTNKVVINDIDFRESSPEALIETIMHETWHAITSPIIGYRNSSSEVLKGFDLLGNNDEQTIGKVEALINKARIKSRARKFRKNPKYKTSYENLEKIRDFIISKRDPNYESVYLDYFLSDIAEMPTMAFSNPQVSEYLMSQKISKEEFDSLGLDLKWHDKGLLVDITLFDLMMDWVLRALGVARSDYKGSVLESVAKEISIITKEDQTGRTKNDIFLDKNINYDAYSANMFGTAQGNQFTTPSESPRPNNSRPDDNARIMSEANAAGFNELIKELVKVHRDVGEEMGIKLEDFLDAYGRPGSKKLSDIKKILDKELSQHGKSSDGISIDDAGLNKVARSFGVRKAIANLEAVREKARKNKSSAVTLSNEIEMEMVEGRNMYVDLLKGRFPPRVKLGERVKKRLQSTKFEVLQDYVKALPNSGISQENLNDINDITTDQLLDIMDAVAEAKGDIDSMTKAEFNAKLETISDSRLNLIKGSTLQQKAKRYAVMRAIKESQDAMSLLRLSKNMIGTLEERYQDAAEQIARADSVTLVDGVSLKFPGIMSTPLKHFARLKKFELENKNKLGREKKQVELYEKINSILEDRSTRLRMALGELQPVNVHDGVTLLTMKMENGKWVRNSYKVEIKNGKFVDREGFSKANKDTLIFVRDGEMIKKHGHEPWFEIMREQALMALNEPIMEEQFHVQRAAWYAGLQGLTERFNKLGYAGVKLSQMSTRTVALYRDYATTSQSYAKQFNASLHRVMSKLKIGGNEVYSGLYQDIFWWFDNHPEFAGKEEQGFKELWKHLKANANVPDRALMDDDAKRLIMDMVNKAISARNWEAEVNKRLGNRVRDEEIKVESFINGEMVDFYRLPMEMGYATMPRTLNNGYLADTYRIMKDAKWHGEDVKGILNEASKVKDPEEMSRIYSTLFNDQIVDRFVKPFTNTDVRQSVFRGPKDSAGDTLPMGNSFVSIAFEKSNGDVYEMANYIFDELSENQTEEARAEWQYAFLRQFFGRFRQIQSVATRAGKEKHGMHAGESMRNTPQSLDARMVESRLPKEFFYYNMYDEVSSNIRLALQVATSQFGRNGDNANMAYLEGKETLAVSAERFNNLMSAATKSNHSKPQRSYSRAVKRKALGLLRDQGEANAEKVWNDLYNKSVALGEMQVAFDHLGKYYGKSNVAGPYQDANLLMDILGVQSVAVLNNPKSSMMQALSLFEFPNAFRGLNRLAGKSTAGALGNFVNQSFGGILEAMGVELEKTGRYAQYLNNTHFRMDEMDLPFKEYNSIVGSGGDLAQAIKDSPGLGIKKYIRKLNNISQHHRRYKKDGTRAPIDPLSLITGVFPYVNNVVNHSVGVGAIHAYSDLVLQIAEVIESRGLTEYTEITAEDLGMGNTMGEWIAGEKDGFKRANEMLIGAGAPSVSRLAFDYVDRKKSDKDAMPIDRNMALLVNQVAMNQVSGEGFNSKPSNLYNNDFLKYFSTFLGWPLGKMSRDMDQIFRDKGDKVRTMQALMKYLGMMSVVYAPVGLSFAMLIDWYDEEMLEKPNNLPPINPWAALPVLGPFIAMDDPNFTIYSITSRLAKAGVPFGMGMDLANGIFAKGDPYGAAREISLDSRIFAWSMIKNIYDAMGTWAVAGEFDWQLIGRPIVYGIGGNSVIQMMDLTSAVMDIDSEERRVADYIAMRNNIKKTAYLMGLPLRAPRKGGGTQSGVSINTRQMARAAFAGDSEGFLENYQEAVEAATEYLAEKGRSDDPAEYVADRFKERDIRFGITSGRIGDADFENLLGLMEPDERQKIESAIQAHEHYLRLIGGTPRVSNESRNLNKYEEARRMAATLLR